MNWAWTICLPPAPKLVLMALADIADDIGFCFPSIALLAMKVSMDERSVQRILRKLTGDGFVSIEQRFRADRAQTSNGYRLAIDHLPAICHPPPDTRVTGGVTLAPGGGRRGCHRGGDNGVTLTTTEPPIYPSPQPQHAPARESCTKAVASNEGRGGDLCFPIGVSPTEQRGLREQLAGLKPGKAQQVLDELAGRMAKTQVHNPLRYCATLVERVKQGKFQPELALAVAQRRHSEQWRQEPVSDRSTAREVTAGPHSKQLFESIRMSLKGMRPKSQSAQPKCDSEAATASVDEAQPEHD